MSTYDLHFQRYDNRVFKNGPLVYFDDYVGKYRPILTIFHCYDKKFMTHKN